MSNPDLPSPKNMIAQDLFSKDLIQVFDTKSGEWIATVKAGQEINIKAPEDEAQEQAPQNKNQLKLF